MDTVHDDSGGPLGSAEDGAEEEDYSITEVADLQRMWLNEKYAPEILPYNQKVIENVSELLEHVSEELDEERLAEDQDPNDASLVLRLRDAERIRYVLRDYLRIRLWKLSQWPQHYLEQAHIQLLSLAERTFLREFWLQKKKFFENRLCDALPPPKRTLDDVIDLLDMVRRPCLEKYVYAKINEDIGRIEVPTLPSQVSEGSTQSEEFTRGRLYLVRYDYIRQFLVNPEHAGPEGTYPKVDLL